MTPKPISSKLSKGDQVRFKDNTLLWFDKPFNPTQGFFKNENGGLYRKNYNNIMKIQGKPIQEMDLKSILKEEIDNAIENQRQETLEFEKDPTEYILQKYPSLEATLTDLMSPVYKDYITSIFVVSPKPTTFKILLHNGRNFLLIYNPKAYMAKVSGKVYHLMNLKDEEYAIKAISNLLLQGLPPGSAGPGEEIENETDMKDQFVQDMTAEPGDENLDLDGVDTSEVPNEEAPEEEEAELQEDKEVQVKKPIRFRIIRENKDSSIFRKKNLIEARIQKECIGLNESDSISHTDTEIFMELADPDMAYNYSEDISNHWGFEDKYGNKLEVSFDPSSKYIESYFVLKNKKGEWIEVYDYDKMIGSINPEDGLVGGKDEMRSNTICKIIRDEIIPKYLINKTPQLIKLHPISEYRRRIFLKCAEICKEKYPQIQIKEMGPEILLINK